MWLPEEYGTTAAPTASRSTSPATYPYFLALQQDYEQMPRQQRGLRNAGLEHISLVKEEVSDRPLPLASLDRYATWPER